MAANSFPSELPSLPSNNGAIIFSNSILGAHATLADIYSHALRISSQADSDPLRVAFHIDAITSDAIPILAALERETEHNGVPLSKEWLISCAELFGHLVTHLRSAAELGKGRDDAKIDYPTYVFLAQTGKRGRPRKQIDLDFLAEATTTHRGLKMQDLADLLGVHRNTLRRYMQRHNVLLQYSNLSNADLDILLRTFKERKPEAGMRYVVGFLRKHGLRVQRHRVISSMKRIDSLGQALRQRKAITRKRYSVKRPNSLWHLDGHHKMIRWGIVIHGFVDGYSRTVTGLHASNNNCALTVLDLFLDAIAEYGMPSRLRGDRGGENIACATYIIMKNGPNRASFMWGSSTRNTRIERLWVEVGTHFVRRWRAFFTRLERVHHLDPSDSVHLWLLHMLFLDAINEDCADFAATWNAHPMQSAGTQNRSPNDMRFFGKARFGVHRDECDGIHPDIINLYYGADQKRARAGPSGAGNPPDEVDTSETAVTREDDTIPSAEVLEDISQTQHPHVRHEGVAVAEERHPFTSEANSTAFFNDLEAMVKDNIVPMGYNVLSSEWVDGRYPDTETLHIGVRNRKELVISLGEAIWAKRATLWAQAVHCLTKHT